MKTKAFFCTKELHGNRFQVLTLQIAHAKDLGFAILRRLSSSGHPDCFATLHEARSTFNLHVTLDGLDAMPKLGPLH